MTRRPYRLPRMIRALIRPPRRIPRQDRRYFSLTNAAGLGGFFGHLVLLLSFAYFEIWPMVWFNMGSLALFASVFVMNRFGYHLLGLYLSIFEIVTHAVVATVLAGWNLGFYFYLFLVFMVVFLAKKEHDSYSLKISVLNMLVFLGLLIYTNWAEYPHLEVGEEAVHFYSLTNLLITSASIAIGFYYYKHTANHVEQELETMNKKVTDSIRYAHRIQQALLPDDGYLGPYVSNHFIFFQPRDIVSGDFYWFHYDEASEQLFVSVFDCTGHGVPGAFMTMMGSVLLESIVVERGIREPDQVLEELHRSIVMLLKQGTSNRQEGMDMGVCLFDFKARELRFSGAKNSLIYVEKGELKEIKGSRRAVGGQWKVKREPKPYEPHVLPMGQGLQAIYLFTDGFSDQFGGSDNQKYTSKRFRELLESAQASDMPTQRKRLDEEFHRWMKNPTQQLDDVLVLGIQL
jgi:serine phosphatase RsbU (regulator of sigma subunit)